MKKNILIFAIFLIFMLCGCNATEPNDIAYVTAIGIDKAEDDTFVFTFQFANTKNISGGASEEGGEGGEITEILEIKAPELYSAINLGNHVLSKNLSLSHMQIFIFSSEVSKDGLNPFLNIIEKNTQIRPGVYFAISMGEAKEYLENVTPITEINPSRYYQLIFERNNLGGLPKNQSYEFLAYQKNEEKQSVLPLVGTADSDCLTDENFQKNNELLAETGFFYKLKNNLAGEIGATDKNKSEAVGMAVFKGDKLVGYMGNIECVIYNIINGTYKSGYLTFKTSVQNNSISVKAEQAKKPHMIYDKENNTVTIKFKINCDFGSFDTDLSEEEFIKIFEEEAKREFEAAAEVFIYRIQHEFKSDILGIGEKIRSQYSDKNTLKNTIWSEKYTKLNIKTEARFKIKRMGMIMENGSFEP